MRFIKQLKIFLKLKFFETWRILLAILGGLGGGFIADLIVHHGQIGLVTFPHCLGFGLVFSMLICLCVLFIGCVIQEFETVLSFLGGCLIFLLACIVLWLFGAIVMVIGYNSFSVLHVIEPALLGMVLMAVSLIIAVFIEWIKQNWAKAGEQLQKGQSK